VSCLAFWGEILGQVRFRRGYLGRCR
jgi:hypothetical protein